MPSLFANIPPQFSGFLLVTIFSLLIGLSQRKLHSDREEFRLIGTDRTFTFMGILGYILLVCQPVEKYLYMGGGAVVAVFFSIYYWQKIKANESYGITTLLIGLITYTIPLLVQTQPFWLTVLVVVVILVFTEMKDSFGNLAARFDRDELVTLAKFLAIGGVILPVVPDTPIVPYLTITPYKIWLAVVAISSISYISYLLRKFVFPDKGIWITGLLGGMYSTAATTFVLSKKMRVAGADRSQYVGPISLAMAMMYLRILILAYIFSPQLAHILQGPLLVLFAVSLIIALVIYWTGRKHKLLVAEEWSDQGNPLEFKIALLFTVLYLIFTFATYWSVDQFGNRGLSTLSFLVGITDIDPFLLNLFQGKYAITNELIAVAALQAMASNNLIKMLYALSLSRMVQWKRTAISFSILVVLNLLAIILI